MIWASLNATAVGHRQPRKRRQHKYRASTNAGVCPLWVNDVLLANLGTRGVVRPSSRCGYRRRVLLWHELGCASGADGAVRRRLPVAAFVPASERTALVVSWGSEHVADWPRGFRSGRSSTATSSDMTRRPPSWASRSTTWRALALIRLTLADAWDESEERPSTA